PAPPAAENPPQDPSAVAGRTEPSADAVDGVPVAEEPAVAPPAAPDVADAARATEPSAESVTASSSAEQPNPAGAPGGAEPARTAASDAQEAEEAEPRVAAIQPRDAARDSQDLQPQTQRPGKRGKRVRVQRGDTLMNLATREYGTATYTTLDVVRAANPEIRDVNRIIAGSELIFPDPGPSSRV